MSFAIIGGRASKAMVGVFDAKGTVRSLAPFDA